MSELQEGVGWKGNLVGEDAFYLLCDMLANV
jgi:hypothetical protein